LASEFQARVGRLLAGAGLWAVEEYEILIDGLFVARVDFAFPDEKVVVEADGYATHSGRLDWQHDLARRNALTRDGWAVLHVTWEDLDVRPGGVVADVRAALRQPRRRT
jgi:very-short-patch-repair endonuclease